MPYTSYNADLLFLDGDNYIHVNPSSLAELIKLSDDRTVEDVITSLEATINAQEHAHVVADIDGRDQLALGNIVQIVYVLDATGDTTVAAGGATYLWDGAAYHKIAEFESLDLELTWANLEGKPTSAVADIDQAVTDSHTHENKEFIDKISESDGAPTYDGVLFAMNPIVAVSDTEPTNGATIWIKP
jgi:hypothetical protein